MGWCRALGFLKHVEPFSWLLRLRLSKHLRFGTLSGCGPLKSVILHLKEAVAIFARAVDRHRVCSKLLVLLRTEKGKASSAGILSCSSFQAYRR